MTDTATFDLQAAREEILEYCLRSMEYGLNFNTQGNISIRVPGAENQYLITPTDLEYDRMTPADIVLVGPHLAHDLEHIERQAAARGATVVLLPADIFDDLDGSRTLALVRGARPVTPTTPTT